MKPQKVTRSTNALTIVLCVLCFFAASNSVSACTCPEYGTPVCASYWRSDAVFVGQLRDITPQPRSANIWPSANLHFVVEQPFRGITTATIDVGTPFGTTCDMGFVKGKRYLIYAYRDSPSNQLLSGPCTRAIELEHAVDDLKYIRALAQQGVKESIAGRVERMKYMPMPGVKVEVRSDKQSFETRTDEKGDFSISLPGPGTYTVRVLIPAAVSVLSTLADLIDKYEITDTLTTMEYKVKLEKSQCDYRHFDLFPVDVPRPQRFRELY